MLASAGHDKKVKQEIIIRSCGVLKLKSLLGLLAYFAGCIMAYRHYEAEDHP